MRSNVLKLLINIPCVNFFEHNLRNISPSQLRTSLGGGGDLNFGIPYSAKFSRPINFAVFTQSAEN